MVRLEKVMSYTLHPTDTPGFFLIRAASGGGLWVVEGLDAALSKLRELMQADGITG